ncbi:MAG: hypothetical protein GY810_05590 [Aureispira sp.]|nr:hypothetical protein [Aureispira sp.]
MSKSEKGFFKKFTAIHSRKGENNYVKIFNAIDKQKVYDEAKLLKKFKSENFVKHFAVTKKYLFDTILKGLKAYHAKYLISHQITQLKSEISILIDRMLYYEASKHVAKAKKAAYQIEAFPMLLEFLELERNLFGMHTFENSTTKKSAIDQEISEVLKKIENQNFYTNLYDQFYAYLRQHSNFASKEDQKRFSKLLDQPLLQNINQALSTKAKRSFWAIQATFATLSGDTEKPFEVSQQVMQLWENKPEIIGEQPTYYWASICTHINHLYRSRRIPELKKWIGKLYDFEPTTLNLQISKFERYSLYQLSLIELTQEFNQLDAFVESYEEDKMVYEDLLHNSEQRLILYNITHLYIQAQQYSKALEYAQKLTQIKASEVQQDLQRFGFILLAIAAYSLQKSDLLKQTIMQYQEFLEGATTVHKYEQLILEVLATNPVQWANFADQIQVLRDDPYEAYGFQYFDLDKWIENIKKGQP